MVKFKLNCIPLYIYVYMYICFCSETEKGSEKEITEEKQWGIWFLLAQLETGQKRRIYLAIEQ